MRYRLLLLAALLTAKTGICQSIEEVEFGPHAGLNLAYVKSTNASRKVDFHIGLFALAKTDLNVSYLSELTYSRQGVKNFDESSLRANYNYLNLAVMPCYFATEQFFVFAGPQVGYLLSAKITGGLRLVDLKEDLQPIDFSLCGGAGVSIGHLQFTARYNYGITNTEKLDPDDTRVFSNQVVQFSVGFKVH